MAALQPVIWPIAAAARLSEKMAFLPPTRFARLTVIAGVLRELFLLVTAAKVGRYLVLAAVTLSVI
ncbi:hypothetical protein NKI63_20815 [Mesorhizobium sp. M0410]